MPQRNSPERTQMLRDRIIMRASRKPTHWRVVNKLPENGARECARRRRQMRL